MRGALAWKAAWVAALCAAVLALSSGAYLVWQTTHYENECAMTRSRPSLLPVPVMEEAGGEAAATTGMAGMADSTFAGYALFRAFNDRREEGEWRAKEADASLRRRKHGKEKARVSARAQPPKQKRQPVLFVPGNLGSARQVRSLTSHVFASYLAPAEAEQYAQQLGHPPPLAPEVRRSEQSRALNVKADVFALDFGEEMTGGHGFYMLRQATFMNAALHAVLDRYPANTTVIVVGHSYGGMVARLAPLLSNYPRDSIRQLITLSTPHNGPPLALDASIHQVYNVVNGYWKQAPGVVAQWERDVELGERQRQERAERKRQQATAVQDNNTTTSSNDTNNEKAAIVSVDGDQPAADSGTRVVAPANSTGPATGKESTSVSSTNSNSSSSNNSSSNTTTTTNNNNNNETSSTAETKGRTEQPDASKPAAPRRRIPLQRQCNATSDPLTDWSGTKLRAWPCWAVELNHVAVIEISGGTHDEMVLTEQHTQPWPHISAAHSLAITTTEIDDVGISVSHDVLVWCFELLAEVTQLIQAFADLNTQARLDLLTHRTVDSSANMPTSSVQAARRVFGLAPQQTLRSMWPLAPKGNKTEAEVAGAVTTAATAGAKPQAVRDATKTTTATTTTTPASDTSGNGKDTCVEEPATGDGTAAPAAACETPLPPTASEGESDKESLKEPQEEPAQASTAYTAFRAYEDDVLGWTQDRHLRCAKHGVWREGLRLLARHFLVVALPVFCVAVSILALTANSIRQLVGQHPSHVSALDSLNPLVHLHFALFCTLLDTIGAPGLPARILLPGALVAAALWSSWTWWKTHAVTPCDWGLMPTVVLVVHYLGAIAVLALCTVCTQCVHTVALVVSRFLDARGLLRWRKKELQQQDTGHGGESLRRKLLPGSGLASTLRAALRSWSVFLCLVAMSTIVAIHFTAAQSSSDIDGIGDSNTGSPLWSWRYAAMRELSCGGASNKCTMLYWVAMLLAVEIVLVAVLVVSFLLWPMNHPGLRAQQTLLVFPLLISMLPCIPTGRILLPFLGLHPRGLLPIDLLVLQQLPATAATLCPVLIYLWVVREGFAVKMRSLLPLAWSHAVNTEEKSVLSLDTFAAAAAAAAIGGGGGGATAAAAADDAGANDTTAASQGSASDNAAAKAKQGKRKTQARTQPLAVRPRTGHSSCLHADGGPQAVFEETGQLLDAGEELVQVAPGIFMGPTFHVVQCDCSRVTDDPSEYCEFCSCPRCNPQLAQQRRRHIESMFARQTSSPSSSSYPFGFGRSHGSQSFMDQLALWWRDAGRNPWSPRGLLIIAVSLCLAIISVVCAGTLIVAAMDPEVGGHDLAPVFPAMSVVAGLHCLHLWGEYRVQSVAGTKPSSSSPSSSTSAS